MRVGFAGSVVTLWFRASRYVEWGGADASRSRRMLLRACRSCAYCPLALVPEARKGSS